ncbi:hypothetical protein BCR41DRAFT_158755 [Lobosporangium transversale]|uniref:Uncharacterized protein n=1 Tax=Lobosporangium transversale TaxID=64571 RepID=A0A1Y2GFP9_9FUNG|nr:hypothetical protein BCR41DRAFT_158755 [Lobosporangium transversale]ORZ07775.1 hypothetical protein BCR41DRAFT_158755 [Lobosporangium transversale]|eukprot:XP_021878141.1 hypothetical protein BCR41DRAFT_158755 [Lobosporangium transversale]
MKAFQLFLTITLVALFFMSSSDAACICMTTISRKHHCGRSPLLSGCEPYTVYKCDGVYGSVAQSVVSCKKGCVYNPDGQDHCKS